MRLESYANVVILILSCFRRERDTANSGAESATDWPRGPSSSHDPCKLLARSDAHRLPIHRIGKGCSTPVDWNSFSCRNADGQNPCLACRIAHADRTCCICAFDSVPPQYQSARLGEVPLQCESHGVRARESRIHTRFLERRALRTLMVPKNSSRSGGSRRETFGPNASADRQAAARLAKITGPRGIGVGNVREITAARLTCRVVVPVQWLGLQKREARRDDTGSSGS